MWPELFLLSMYIVDDDFYIIEEEEPIALGRLALLDQWLESPEDFIARETLVRVLFYKRTGRWIE